MYDAHFMEEFDSADHLDAILPDFRLRDVALLFLSSINQLLQIASLCVLHDDTERASSFFIEGFFVTNDLRVVQRS